MHYPGFYPHPPAAVPGTASSWATVSTTPGTPGVLGAPYMGTIPLPSTSTSEVNPAVSYRPDRTIIDVAAAFTSQYFNPSTLTQHAIYPITRRITIQGGPGKWARSIENPATGITVQDILTGVYGLYHEYLSPEEHQYLRGDALTQARACCVQRCRGDMNELSRGLKRVDCLGGRTRFCGVSSTPDGATWVVYMG